MKEKFWKAYFYFMIILFILLSWRTVANLTVFTWIDMALSLVTLVALYGFSFNKKILIRLFWQISFFVCVISEICGLTISIIENIKSSIIITIIAFTLVLAIILPIYIAMFLYGFRRENLWIPQNKGAV